LTWYAVWFPALERNRAGGRLRDFQPIGNGYSMVSRVLWWRSSPFFCAYAPCRRPLAPSTRRAEAIRRRRKLPSEEGCVEFPSATPQHDLEPFDYQWLRVLHPARFLHSGCNRHSSRHVAFVPDVRGCSALRALCGLPQGPGVASWVEATLSRQYASVLSPAVAKCNSATFRPNRLLCKHLACCTPSFPGCNSWFPRTKTQERRPPLGFSFLRLPRPPPCQTWICHTKAAMKVQSSREPAMVRKSDRSRTNRGAWSVPFHIPIA
jgi:hypothetical protein